MAKRNPNMPRKSQYATQEAYEKAKLDYIIKFRKKRRRAAAAIRVCSVLLILLLSVGAGFAGYSLLRFITGRSAGGGDVAETVLARRHEDLNAAAMVTAPPTETPDNDLKICIDPGHGAQDPGANRDGRLEKDDTLALGLALRDQLKAMGVEVVMTRDSDTYPTLGERAYIANQSGCDYFISIHRNALDDDVVTKGVQIYCKNDSKEALRLGNLVMDHLETVGISANRGVGYGSNDSGDFQVNREAEMPSILLEIGFISNREDNNLLDAHMEEYAKGIAQSFVDMLSEDTEVTSYRGLKLSNDYIADISQVDNTQMVWAPGISDLDEQKRPGQALEYNNTYAAYRADFIKDTTEKTMYLTFDCGYSAAYTGQILDILKNREVSAVFFINESFARENPELVERMIEEGHIIGSRGKTAREDFSALSDEEAQEEISSFHQFMLDTFQYRMCLFRYVNGNFSPHSLALINNCDYSSVFWSFSYGDDDTGNQPDIGQSLTVLKSCAHPGAIYLLSASSATDAAILDSFIAQMQEAGYAFSEYSIRTYTKRTTTNIKTNAITDDTAVTDAPEEDSQKNSGGDSEAE